MPQAWNEESRFRFLVPRWFQIQTLEGAKKSHVAIISFKPLKKKKAAPSKKVQKIEIKETSQQVEWQINCVISVHNLSNKIHS